MIMINVETNIIHTDKNFKDVDIVTLYKINNDLELTKEYFDYDYKNSTTIVDSDLLTGKPNFSSIANEIKKELEDNQPIVILNYWLIKNSFGKYGINIDNYNIIDISHILNKTKAFGNIDYKLENIINKSNIEHKNDRMARGEQLNELFNLLQKDFKLSIEEMLYLNYFYKSNGFDINSSKYNNLNLNQLPITTLFHFLNFENLTVQTNGCTNQEFKFNLIRFILEDSENCHNLNIKHITDKKEFDSVIKLLFEGDGTFQTFNIDTKYLENTYKMCDLYFDINNNQIKFEKLFEIYQSFDLDENNYLLNYN